MGHTVYLSRSNTTMVSSLEELRLQTGQLREKYHQVVKDRDAALVEIRRAREECQARESEALSQTRRAQITQEEAQARVKSLEQAMAAMAGSNPAKKDLVELSTRVAILEGSVVALEKREEYYRRESESRGAELARLKQNAASESFAMRDKYIRLRGLYNKSLDQLGVLFEQVKDSVPLKEYNGVALQLSTKKSQLGLTQLKEIELRSKLSDLESSAQLLRLKSEELETVLEENCDLQLENALLGHRLELLDESYAKYTGLMKRLALTLKNKGTSPTNFFAQSIHDSKELSRKQLEDALHDIGVAASKEEVDHFMTFMDLDNNGGINLVEFFGKMRRAGVVIRSRGEEAVLVVGRVMREMNYSVKDCFRAIDAQQRGQVTLEDMDRFFKDVGRPLKKEDLRCIFQLCNKDHRPLSF
jgi:Ca2+-binding EF-hand superfamily protein